jgi:anti-anti-sigma factor
MPLNVRVDDGPVARKTLVLEGRLDNDSVGTLDEVLDPLLDLDSDVQVVVFDLGGLEYITSAGLRSIFRAQKAMNARAGKALLVNPSPQVRKVLEIVKIPELGVLFRNVQELDSYLDAMQKKVAEGE